MIVLPIIRAGLRKNRAGKPRRENQAGKPGRSPEKPGRKTAPGKSGRENRAGLVRKSGGSAHITDSLIYRLIPHRLLLII